MATKVEVAKAAVAKIANKTLKPLCMVSIRGYAKTQFGKIAAVTLKKGSIRSIPSIMTGLVKRYVRLIANDC